MDIALVGLLVSFFMALYLFSVAFIEAIKISNQEGKVKGTTLIMSVSMGFIFTHFSHTFYN
ncbi:hypothetical protein ELQ35_18755 [Peribacillus cavernae]|uniref:Uncharacterized protein n=1 Tax=Peribacillus cavernae TaxID=1674310 RepID=A0A3S0UA11_9BACI|nr:hypothetical protein [Peribacillus cavernae]MDQ0219572.1 hypothetical protein [Peribacillus cavernae]RUQ25866.1 hypothetical protein ELQ35_18755 [Peribacillus cavernae]